MFQDSFVKDQTFYPTVVAIQVQLARIFDAVVVAVLTNHQAAALMQKQFANLHANATLIQSQFMLLPYRKQLM